MNRYIVIKNFKNKTKVKKGMFFQWDKSELCYTTKELPWFITPLLDRYELNWLIKNGFLKKV
jgi:hypothetical protein